MSLDTCELCGNQSKRFTCQMCITTGNFWIDKARFSFSGKKQIITNLLTEKTDLENRVASSYYSSYLFKDSIKRSIQSEIQSLKERIRHTKQQTALFKSQVDASNRKICVKDAFVVEKKESMVRYSEEMSYYQDSLSENKTKLTEIEDNLKLEKREVLSKLNESIFKLSRSNADTMSLLNILFNQCENASSYVKQIKIYRNEELSNNTCVVFSLLVQLCDVLSLILNCNMPYHLDQNSFVGQARTSRHLFNSVKQLSSNILYLCLSQQVHPELLEPYAFISNLQQLFECEDTCTLGPFCHSLDRPGDSDKEETPPTSSDSDAEWENVAQSQGVPTSAPIPSSSSYIGSLIWNTEK